MEGSSVMKRCKAMTAFLRTNALLWSKSLITYPSTKKRGIFKNQKKIPFFPLTGWNEFEAHQLANCGQSSTDFEHVILLQILLDRIDGQNEQFVRRMQKRANCQVSDAFGNQILIVLRQINGVNVSKLGFEAKHLAIDEAQHVLLVQRNEFFFFRKTRKEEPSSCEDQACAVRPTVSCTRIASKSPPLVWSELRQCF
jgi:hypothetical protein